MNFQESMTILNAHTKKKSGNLSNAPCVCVYIYIYIYIVFFGPVKPELGVIPSGPEIIHE